MSLLLDALKKSGEAQRQEANSQHPSNKGDSDESVADNSSELSLEALPAKPATVTPVSVTNSNPRSTGENLFAAKKAPARKQFGYNLGIVPTALIIGLLLGTAGAIYVWIEIQPPKVSPQRAQPPAVIADAAPARRPPPLVLPPDSMPTAETQKITSRPAPVAESRTRVTGTKRAASSQAAPAAQSIQGVQIQKQFENDTVYVALTAAYQAYQNGDLATAWQRYRAVLQKDPKNRDALLGMAAIAQQQGQDETAMQLYKQVLMLDPRDPAAQAGLSAFASGDAAGKESRLKLSLVQSPLASALHFALGNLYTEQSRWGDAQQAYFNAFRLEPANAQFAFNLATSLDHLGQAKLAAQYYGQALKLDTTGNAGFDRVHTQTRLNQLLAQ